MIFHAIFDSEGGLISRKGYPPQGMKSMGFSSDFIPKEKPKQPIYLLVYRDQHYEIGFVELNQIAAKLIEELQRKSNKTGEQILQQIAGQLKHLDPNIVMKGGSEVMQNLKNRDIILGVKDN